LIFDRLESTNTQAADLASDPNNDGVVVIAREQTAGRGQHGRAWQCPPGSGVLMSVLLFPPPDLRRPVVLTAWAAVSVCETIRQVSGLPATIKWPNDVLVRDKKVCGILIEQNRGTVVGIGLNVNQSAADLAGAGLTVAGSLACFTGRHFDCMEIGRQLVFQLDDGHSRVRREDLATLEALWTDRLGLVGTHVHVECLDGTRQGLLRDCGFGGLTIELSDGVLFQTAPESVRQVVVSGES
jgi:BirA family biotin operon repressor/biotin-[acetyl-CoA-carboxylase] ligase